MRLHRNLVYTTIDSLNAIFNEENMQIKWLQALKKTSVGEADRKFVAETIYEVYDGKDYMLK
jgi:16S rRNA (cytosine967-C5)-methyltransferase